VLPMLALCVVMFKLRAFMASSACLQVAGVPLPSCRSTALNAIQCATHGLGTVPPSPRQCRPVHSVDMVGLTVHLSVLAQHSVLHALGPVAMDSQRGLTLVAVTVTACRHLAMSPCGAKWRSTASTTTTLM
jgi:hypothetical protein